MRSIDRISSPPPCCLPAQPKPAAGAFRMARSVPPETRDRRLAPLSPAAHDSAQRSRLSEWPNVLPTSERRLSIRTLALTCQRQLILNGLVRRCQELFHGAISRLFHGAISRPCCLRSLFSRCRLLRWMAASGGQAMRFLSIPIPDSRGAHGRLKYNEVRQFGGGAGKVQPPCPVRHPR